MFAFFLESCLDGTRLKGASFCGTIFGDCDLSRCLGLEAAEQIGTNTIGVDTLTATLEGCGRVFSPSVRQFFIASDVPAELLNALPTILRNRAR